MKNTKREHLCGHAPDGRQNFRVCSECTGMKRKGLSAGKAEKIVEAHQAASDKLKCFGFAENGIDVAPAQIRKEGDFSD